MNPIKICHVIQATISNHLLINTIKNSDRSRFDYTIVTLDPEGKLHEEAAQINVPVVTLNKPSRRQMLQTIAELVRFFRSRSFDIVQVHGFDASLVALPAALLAGVKKRVFSGHHSHEVPLHNSKRLKIVDSFLARRLATDVIAPSKDMYDIFVQTHRVPTRKLHLIPHGIDLGYWSPEKFNGQSMEQRRHGKIVFGAVGRLYWIKAYDQLLRAFAPVAKRHPDVVIWMVGEGADLDALKSLCGELGLSEQVFFLGASADVREIVSGFDVFIHPALAESFGLVYVETMALKKPQIGAAVGIAPEAIEDGVNGYLVQPGDVEGLSNAMEAMLTRQAEWKTMGEKALRAAERYSVRITQVQCDEFYSSLVEPNRV